LPDDTLEDLTGPINDLLSDEGSLSPLTLDDGTPSAKPRPYQLEMVQESLNKNIIIAMDTGSGRTHWYFCADGVERWTKQSLWDGVLGNVRVVVSTYQILLDALTHAVVKMEQLALIVFDE
ncbi:hypothetical protein F5882DRAFT_252622, partial [Hyaloscypha sp. PMI_1271]